MSSESKLSKWQVAALGIGAAAVVAGGAIVAYACVKRRRRTIRDTTDPDATPTPQTASQSSSIGMPSETAATTIQPPSEQRSALDQARAIKQQGNEFFKQQKFDEAIRCYQEAIKVCPEETTADIAIFHQNIGAVYDQMASRETDEDLKTSYLQSVVDACTASLKLSPRYVKALTRRVKAHHSLGNNREALLDVTRACLVDESQGKTLAEIVPNILKKISQQRSKEMFPKLGPLPPTRNMVKTYFESLQWNDDLSEARLRALWVQRAPRPTPKPNQSESDQSAVESGDAETAAEGNGESAISDEANGAEPEVDLYEGFDEEPFVQAAAQFHAANYHGILELLTEAIDNGHVMFLPHALLLRGTLYALWREDERALKDLLDVVNKSGEDKQMCVSALVRRAGIFAGCGEMEKATTCFEKALAIDSEAVDIYINRARILLETAEDPAVLSSCISDLEKALKMCPNSAHTAYSLASTHHRLAAMAQSIQMLETARAKFDEARGKFPDFADGLILQALFLQDCNQFKEAEELLKKVAKMQPDNPLCHFSLGLLTIVKSGRIEEGVQYMEKAIEVDCSCVQAYDTLAAVEMQKGNFDKAIDLYTRAINNSRSQVELAQVIASREIIDAQNQVCQEYGVSPKDLASRPVPTAPF